MNKLYHKTLCILLDYKYVYCKMMHGPYNIKLKLIRSLNEGRGSGALRILNQELKEAPARGEKHPKGNCLGQWFPSREDPLASSLIGCAYGHSFAASLAPATNTSLLLCTLLQRHIFQMFVYSLL